MNLIAAYLDFNALLRVVNRVLVTFEDQGEMLLSALLKLSHKKLWHIILINYMATHLSQAPFARIEISIFCACQPEKIFERCSHDISF